MNIYRIDPQMVRVNASFLTGLIKKAADVSQQTPESLVDLAENGKADFWVAHDKHTPVGVCFTQIVQKPKERVVTVLAIGGVRGTRWITKLYKQAGADAKQQGATKVTFYRVGGRKTFMGHKPTGYYYEVPL